MPDKEIPPLKEEVSQIPSSNFQDSSKLEAESSRVSEIVWNPRHCLLGPIQLTKVAAADQFPSSKFPPIVHSNFATLDSRGPGCP